jgi:hypothetical protein
MWGRAHLSNPGRHDADTVERRAIDQFRAYDSVDQHILLRIDGAMDLERLEESEAEANATTSDFGNPGGTTIGPTARQAIENRLGSSANPSPPLIPPVSARDI